MGQPARGNLARAAGSVMLAFLIAQFLGLARRVLVARAFGASADLDAFIAANRVSETLFNLVAGGALGSAFIPTFTGLLAQEKRREAWQLASAVANWIVLLLSLLALLAALFAPSLVRYALAPGFYADPQQFRLTVHLLRIQVSSAVIFGLSGLVMGILNAHGVFFIPALTPAMYQLGMIAALLLLSPAWGIRGLAWGVVIGAAGHLLVQSPSLLRLPSPPHGKYHLTLGWTQPAVLQVARLMAPRLFGVAVVQINFWVNIWLASRMVEGSITGIEYAFALMLMAEIAIAQSVATAILPTLSADYALGNLSRLRATLVQALRAVIFLALPAAAGLAILRFPLIELLYQRGEFTPRSTQLVAWALLWYALGLPAHSLLEVLARAFYAMQDTRTPVQVGAAAMSLNLLFSLFFSALFARSGWMPHGGLALANSLATLLEALTLLWLMRRRLQGIEGKRLTLGLIQSLSATLLMSLVLALALRTLPSGTSAILPTLGSVLAGALIYFSLLWLLGVPEVRRFPSGRRS
uniref:Probable lipid II flippase MurJ n=1 Tax=uncultured Chloroflexota bacterium TaxID=166587 RepID=H5S8P7_9CHLR|nr:virulence factor MviN [uncultured Chloroflexota bacterium]